MALPSICVALYDAIIKLRPDWHSDEDDAGVLKVVMTGSASDPEAWQAHIGKEAKARRTALAKAAGSIIHIKRPPRTTWLKMMPPADNTRRRAGRNNMRSTFHGMREAIKAGEEAEPDRHLRN